MITFALRIDHKVWPGHSPEAAKAIGEALDHPAFRALSRAAYNRGDRDSRHQPRTAEAVTEILLSANCDAVFLDSGRTSKQIASATIFTGRHVRNYDVENRLIDSHVIVPCDAAHPLEIIEGFSALATAVDAFAGNICVERDHVSALGAALGRSLLPHEVRDFPRRAQERQAHFLYFARRETQIAGPEWGLFLGPGHLARVTPDPAVFPIIRDVGRGKLCLLSENPADALSEAFDARLEEARRALAPILMDVSEVPIGE